MLAAPARPTDDVRRVAIELVYPLGDSTERNVNSVSKVPALPFLRFAYVDQLDLLTECR